MNQREKILAAAVLGLVGLWGLRMVYGGYVRGQDQRQSQLQAAQDELAKLQHSLRKGERAVRNMQAWQERSLPADRDRADSLYKAWLQAKAKDAGLKVETVTPAGRSNASAGYTAIAYRMEATGSLADVVKMLHSFYTSPLLQQVTRLQMTRPPGGSELQVSFEAEALSLPGATATDSLPEGDPKRLQLASLEEYQKSLGERNLASVYTPPRPPRDTTVSAPPPPPKFDDSEHAYFTSTVGVGDELQAWINVRTTGETLKLNPGEAVKVGALEGQIVSVDRWSLVLQTGDKKFLVPIGTPIRKGKPLDAEPESAADAEAESPKS
jgi:hypothetical protein